MNNFKKKTTQYASYLLEQAEATPISNIYLTIRDAILGGKKNVLQWKWN